MIAKDQSNLEKHVDGITNAINPRDAIYQPSPLEPIVSTFPSQTALPPTPAELPKSEQCSSTIPFGLALATLGHQVQTPNNTGSR